MADMRSDILAIAASLGGGGRFLSSVTQLPRFQGLGNSASAGFQAGGQGAAYLGTAATWTGTQYGINNWGAGVDSQFTAATYKTIASLTGAGIFFGAIGPAIANSADLTYFRLTKDGGTPVVISWAAGTVVYRCGLGGIVNTTAASYFSTPVPLANGASVYNVAATANTMMLPPGGAELFGLGVRFATSFLVEIKVDTTQNTTTNEERRAAAFYKMEP